MKNKRQTYICIQMMIPLLAKKWLKLEHLKENMVFYIRMCITE